MASVKSRIYAAIADVTASGVGISGMPAHLGD